MLRLYLAALRALEMQGGQLSAEYSIKPIVLFAHALACLVEEYQMMVSLESLSTVA
jgi:hypothetical protein